MARLFVLVSVACTLLALPQTLRGQDTPEVQRLKQQIEALKNKIELQKREIDLLKQGSGRLDADIKQGATPDELVVDLGNGVKMEFIRIKAGEFRMGSPESDGDADPCEKPQHRVTITKDFYLGKYPVTQEQYQAIMGKNPSEFQTSSRYGFELLKTVDTRRFPVDRVRWDDAVEFCGALTRKHKQRGTFCLPTEAEWEYACRAGTTKRYVFADDAADLSLYAWYAQNADAAPYDRVPGNKWIGTHPVGTKKPNPWGLYDMQGNIWQWCADKFGADYYAKSPLEDPKGPDSTPGLHLRVMRGNSWSATRGGAQMSLDSRAANRIRANPGQSDPRFGFRVCLRLD